MIPSLPNPASRRLDPGQAARVFRALGWAARTLVERPEHLFETLRSFLRVLRRASGMETIELFLADPHQRFLILTAYEGVHGEAFLEQSSFAWGEGYPGLVALSPRPLVTHDLGHDPRYLRERVKKLGYSTYVCYPLELPHGLIGVLNLASRDATAEERVALTLLESVGTVLASGLYTVLTRLGEFEWSQDDQGVEALLERSVRLSGAHGTVLHFRDGEPISVAGVLNECPWLANCPVWTGQVASVGTGTMPCPWVEGGEARYCLPWWTNSQVSGVQTLYFSHVPDPPPRAMVPLLWLERHPPPRHQPQPASESPWLEVSSFGGFGVKRDGVQLEPKRLGRRRAWTLLKILVAYRRRPVARDALVERLWPGMPPESGQNCLHGLVHTLRHAIEPNPSTPQIILREGETYRFDPQMPCALDVERFEAIMRRADQQGGPKALETYRQALALYRGEFMEDEPYADWCQPERACLREQAIRALCRVVEILTTLERHLEAQEACWRILSLDPWREEAYHALIGLLERTGRTTEARTMLEDFQRRLAHEGLNPERS